MCVVRGKKRRVFHARVTFSIYTYLCIPKRGFIFNWIDKEPINYYLTLGFTLSLRFSCTIAKKHDQIFNL